MTIAHDSITLVEGPVQLPEFQAWPKTPRLFRDIVITEKIDGTNAAVVIEQAPAGYIVSAQSRKRIITPDSDNFGFARWVADNSYELVELLGPGRHFGEWYGKGIQRGYGMDERWFALFNTTRFPAMYFHDHVRAEEVNITSVPVLYEGTFSQNAIEDALSLLSIEGSHATGSDPDSMWQGPKAEGICIYHSASNQIFKVTLENDEQPKGAVA